MKKNYFKSIQVLVIAFLLLLGFGKAAFSQDAPALSAAANVEQVSAPDQKSDQPVVPAVVSADVNAATSANAVVAEQAPAANVEQAVPAEVQASEDAQAEKAKADEEVKAKVEAQKQNAQELKKAQEQLLQAAAELEAQKKAQQEEKKKQERLRKIQEDQALQQEQSVVSGESKQNQPSWILVIGAAFLLIFLGFGFYFISQGALMKLNLAQQFGGAFSVIIGILGILIAFNLVNFNKAVVSARQVREESAKFAIIAKDMQRNVVQVQQYLTDVSATHDPAGYEEAKQNADEFYSASSEFEKMFKAKKDTANFEATMEIRSLFDDFYKSGQEMAKAYVSGGFEAGNALMEKFDLNSKKLTKNVQELVDAQVNELNKDLTGVEDSNKQAVMLNIILGIISTLFAAGIAVFLTRHIVGSVNGVVNSLRDISEGEGDLTKRLPETSSDELGSMARYFNKFVEKIEDIISNVKDSAAQLNAATEEISASSQQISDGAQQQSASFEELSSSVQANSSNASSANEIAQVTSKEADKAGQGMDHTIEAMGGIEKSSKQITDAVAIITDIAEQTNLLALNAAIEAARAGEHGKGFAVVADEVRKLAERSATSAKEIAELIKQSTKQVEEGVELSKSAGQSLKAIVDNVGKVADQIQSISTATQEQAATMEENTSITESNAAASEQLAASAEEMAAQAEALQNMVNRFKTTSGSSGSPTAAIRKTEHKVVGSSSGGSKVVRQIKRLEWANIYATGVEEIDVQHRKLFKMINELGDAIKAGNGAQAAPQALKFLGDYVKTHFSYEEDCMHRMQCPVAGKNKEAHASFLSLFTKYSNRFKEEGYNDDLVIELHTIAVDWLVKHICGVDVNMKHCVRKEHAKA